MCCLQPELRLQPPTLPGLGPANMLISGLNNRVSDWPFPLIQLDLYFFLKNGNEKPMHLIHGEESPEMAVHIPAWLRTCERARALSPLQLCVACFSQQQLCSFIVPSQGRV